MGFRAKLYRRIPVLLDGLAIYKAYKRHTPRYRYCVCCDKSSIFRMFGYPIRFDALCPSCGSLERHRLLTLALQQNASRLRNANVLHFAPEPHVEAVLHRYTVNYQGCDLFPQPGQIRIDIHAIDLPTSSQDVIVCCDVLEHVDADTALRELRRILRPTGVVFITTPVIEGWAETYENSQVTSPSDRLLHFGQEDHVRYFGSDIRDKIKAAGFAIAEFTATEPNVSKMGLIRGAKVFICS